LATRYLTVETLSDVPFFARKNVSSQVQGVVAV
jgi:hypothetical protein